MNCLVCNNEKLKTQDTFTRNNVTYRRKKCPKCDAVYYTRETFIDDLEGRQKFRFKLKQYQ